MPNRREIEWFWQLGSELRSLSEELLRVNPTSIRTRSFWEPRVDVSESEESIIVTAEIAGVDVESINLSFAPDRHSLIIRGFRAEQEQEADCRIRCYQLEIYYGDFLREVQLPDVPLDTEGIVATCRNGILRIAVPKSKQEVVQRTIPIVEG
jgi:HSP20 family protein